MRRLTKIAWTRYYESYQSFRFHRHFYPAVGVDLDNGVKILTKAGYNDYLLVRRSKSTIYIIAYSLRRNYIGMEVVYTAKDSPDVYGQYTSTNSIFRSTREEVVKLFPRGLERYDERTIVSRMIREYHALD